MTGNFTASPINLTATAGNSNVVLNYQQGTGGAGATSFSILRSLTSGGPYDTIATGVASLTYTDSSAVNGTTYYYVVVGTSGVGGDSGYSNEASATPFVAPAAPVLTATGGYSYINLSWTAIAGAVSYNVKRSATPGGPYTVIGTATGTTFTDQYLGQGAKFYYVVSAVNASGEGPNSNEANATTGAAVPGEIEARILSAPSLNYGSGPYQRFIGAGSSFTYTVTAAAAGSYDIAVSAGNGASEQGYGTHDPKPLQIAVNSGAAQTVTVPTTVSNQFVDVGPVTANLTQGVNTITLTVPDNRPYDLNTIKVTLHGQVITNTLPFTSFYEFYPEIKANTTYTNLFEVHDNNTPADQIVVTASSDNQTLVPNANAIVEKGDFVIYGQHYPRRLSVTPAPNQSGSAIITVVVTNKAGLSRMMFFKLTVDAPALATVMGNIALEGVPNLAVISSAAPLGVFDIQFRTPGTTTIITENKNITLTASAGNANGSYAVTGVAAGTYDVWIKGGKNLAVLVPGVTVTATGWNGR